MMRWVSILTAIAIAAITVASPRFGFIGVFFALAVLAIVFWLSTIVDLLRIGPGAQREWWIASLVLPDRRPFFARDNHNSLHR